MPKTTLDELDDRIDRKIREVVPEAINKALSGQTVPDGYTRCKQCASLYKETLDKCPYCTETPKAEESDDIIDID